MLALEIASIAASVYSGLIFLQSVARIFYLYKERRLDNSGYYYTDNKKSDMEQRENPSGNNGSIKYTHDF